MKKVILFLLIFMLSAITYGQANLDVYSKPQFPGGTKAMTKFFEKTLKYPEFSKRSGLEGTVILEYLLTAEGKIDGKIKIIKSAGAELDKEAIRIVSEMPNWIPAKRNDKPLKIKYRLPIVFQLL